MDISLFTRLRIAVIPSAIARTKYIVKKKLFAEVGENFFFQPRIVPLNAEYIHIHNNVVVASDVTFICHDVMQKVFNNLDLQKQVMKKYGCIEIMDNVFIGANSTILHDVRIGPNAVIAAGSVVTKDVLPGSVVGGVQAKEIGSFDELYHRRLHESENMLEEGYTPDYCWKVFEKNHREC